MCFEWVMGSVVRRSVAVSETKRERGRIGLGFAPCPEHAILGAALRSQTAACTRECRVR